MKFLRKLLNKGLSTQQLLKKSAPNPPATHSYPDSASPSSGSSDQQSLRPRIALCFSAHQTPRLRNYSFFDIGGHSTYEDEEYNTRLIQNLSEQAYHPANALLEEIIRESEGRFCFSMSLSGLLLEQLENKQPQALQSFQKLVATSHVELLAETYYHSMTYHSTEEELEEQIKHQTTKLQELFNVTPTVYRHAEHVYFNGLAAFIEKLGFQGMLAEGVTHLLGERSANFLYQSPNVESLKILMRSEALSDDLRYRILDPHWSQYPLTPEKFANWCEASGGDVLNLQLSYQALGFEGEQQKLIHDFWVGFVKEWLHRGGEFITSSKAVTQFNSAGIYDCHEPTSWAGTRKDLSPWRDNSMQREARNKIFLLEKTIKQSADPVLLHQWRKMQSSEYFHQMRKDGQVRTSDEFDSPYEAYLSFMNILTDLQLRAESGD